MTPYWIWQQPDWPDFRWQAEVLAPLLRECVQAQGQLLGMTSVVTTSLSAQNELDALLQNIVTSSAIEGEQLNVGSVRSSLARRLGLEQVGDNPVSQRSEGLANLLLDATRHLDQPLTLQRLLEWHEWLFPDQPNELAHRQIRVGTLCGDEPMQVVSGRLDRPTVHFEAPPRKGLEQQLQAFVDWFEASRHQAGLDPLLRAGVAHFWFVTLHPFDDGNGRLTRTLTDLALAQGEAQAIRFYAMSASILDDHAGYYRILETSQKNTLDITPWLSWFLQTLQRSLQQAMKRIDSVFCKARFWQVHRDSALTPEQIKVLNRMLDGGEKGFEGGISAAQYQAVAKVSKATATRHLAELLEKGCLERMPGGGRSTRYRVSYPVG
ncbi:Fic family protein [Pseudomonas fluorescens]|uniref:Fic family protein n=1 Tax=Pseudomonas fluorescens TaxID=294 RepID=A0A944DGC7_PSEFL|nr:Fic family protein [Pseudomonas fluorescens]MBT2312039.1 Fic family protein [Pseudomonas fluorescens]MBT2316990.1 Fic family protein [Pseudomonas fluorescens]MBT2327198.1 Fic family protein [Pseudomonas fluorescens]MBT2344809.1 Fic family protein [Pseudomonas fluorescens]MBT2347801.1 Fic family protein [Pseudomonas fluorescens]